MVSARHLGGRVASGVCPGGGRVASGVCPSSRLCVPLRDGGLDAARGEREARLRNSSGGMTRTV